MAKRVFDSENAHDLEMTFSRNDLKLMVKAALVLIKDFGGEITPEIRASVIAQVVSNMVVVQSTAVITTGSLLWAESTTFDTSSLVEGLYDVT
jgi:hypothetical protein